MSEHMQFHQFKLSTGEEIITEIVSEPEEDDINLVVRRAMSLIKVETKDGYRYYSFRPWMTYQTSAKQLQLLNITHIIGEAKPHKIMLEQYFKALEIEAEKNGDIDSDDVDIDNILEQILQNEDNDSDNPSNVVSFSGKRTLH